jgi:Tfp pilus assembly protein PilF
MRFRVLISAIVFTATTVFAQEKQTSEQLYQEAYENFVKRDYVAATASLNRINPVDQKKADILNLRGAIYKRLGELDNAANSYTDALKVNPKDWVPKYNLAEVNFLRAQYKSSRTFLEQALASMPEADRVQKQDLILYKVYLTYLMQGDEEKAKLLLDSFDINSSNPVYYFAQAAWSFSKKDPVKGKNWVNSTEGLYSQDLRNSYGQSLVDVGWLEASSGVTTAASTPVPTLSPAQMAAAATPTPGMDATAAIVPLSTNNAPPVAVAASTPTPEVSSAPMVQGSPDIAVPTQKPTSEKGGGLWWLWILGLLAIGFFFLLKLAKSARIVPPAEDNTGYDAIAASGRTDVAGAVGHSSEGTCHRTDRDGRHRPGGDQAHAYPTRIQRDRICRSPGFCIQPDPYGTANLG